MVVVGIKVLKNKLSEYIRLASQGETVLVTDRGAVVAELTAPGPSRSPVVADALLADLVRRGWLSPPAVASDEPPGAEAVCRYADLKKGLEQDRRDR